MKQFQLRILEDSEVLRPKFRKSGLTEAEKAMKYSIRHKGKKRNKHPSYAGSKIDRRQMCIVKASIRYGFENLKKHIEYLKKEGKGKNGESTELYGNMVTNDSLLSEKQFRFILSPENQNTDLRVLTEELIKRIEHETGFNLIWIAAEHYDKPHKHVHISINGTDLNNRDVVFQRELMKFGLRSFARDICTEMNGVRTKEEVKATQSRSCNADRFTMVDKKLLCYLRSNSITKKKIMAMANTTLYYSRLQHLISLNLCSYDSSKEVFNFKKDFDKELKIYGRYSSYITAFSSLAITPDKYSLHDVIKDGPVQGKIVRRFFMQDDSTTHAVVLEKEDKSYVYVPLKFPPSKWNNGEEIKIEHSLTSEGVSQKGKTEIHRIG